MKALNNLQFVSDFYFKNTFCGNSFDTNDAIEILKYIQSLEKENAELRRQKKIKLK